MSQHILAHLLICTGPACTRCTDRDGHEKLPIDAKALVARWKKYRLYRGVHLTLTGCLGQCGRANQASLLSSGKVVYLEHLDHEADVERLVNWALRSINEDRLAPLPKALKRKCYQRLEPLSEVS